MFVFLRLLFAHLIADFALQTDFIYQLRIRYSWGVIFHSSIFAFLAMVFLTPYLNDGQTWLVILGLWSSHTILDKLKINYFLSTGDDNIWWFLLDQLLHLVIIGAASIALASKETFDLPWMYHGLYYSDLLFQFADGYAFALFVPVALIYYVEKTWWGSAKNIFYPAAHNKYTGILERMSVLSFLLAGGAYYYFIPAALVFSWYLQRIAAKKDYFVYPRLALSLGCCLVTSWWILAQL